MFIASAAAQVKSLSKMLAKSTPCIEYFLRQKLSLEAEKGFLTTTTIERKPFTPPTPFYKNTNIFLPFESFVYFFIIILKQFL